jgi:hypothetical protein
MQRSQQEVIQLKNTVTDVCHAKNKALREMAELKVQVVSLTSELRGDKDEYMDDLRKENLNYENDNMRMYTMVHQFNKLNPSLCPPAAGRAPRGGRAARSPLTADSTTYRTPVPNCGCGIFFSLLNP